MKVVPSRAIVRRFPLAALLVVLALTNACGRVLETIGGQTFEAEFVRVDGANGIFAVKGQQYPYPLTRLSIADRLLIGRAVNQHGITTAGAIGFGGQALNRGGETELTIPLSDPDGLREVKKDYGKPSDQARLLIALPNDFAPATKSYPLLIVSASADGAASSIGAAHQFVAAALAKGFVVLAVDGQFGKPPEYDSTDFRWALVSAALAAIEKEWPQAKDWPIATAGVAGGGGYASEQALKLAGEHARMAGIFLATSAWNPTNFREDLKRVPVSEIADLPIFLSARDDDEIATPKITEASDRALLKTGFKKVRLEHFSGGQKLDLPQLETALVWFLAEAKK